MTTRHEISEAIRGIDARVERVRERILAAGQEPLAEGEWRVRDALSHLAARANGVGRIVRRAEQASTGGAAPARAPGSVDEINAGQVEERRDRTVEQLLDEIRRGHRAALEAVAALDDEILARRIPFGFRPGEASVSEMILRGGPGHDGTHLDQIEAVLPP